MRALLHIRVRSGREEPLLTLAKSSYRLLDFKELESADGERMAMVTIILAENEKPDPDFWRLQVSTFFARIKGMFEDQDTVLLSTLIVDGVTLAEEGGLYFESDLFRVLGK